MKAIYVDDELHQQAKLVAIRQGRTLRELIEEYVVTGLRRDQEAILEQQETTLREAYQAWADVHAQLAEESVHCAVEILDPHEEWPEFQDESLS